MHVKSLLPVLAICFCGFSVDAQKKWTLKDCVEYAMANNISVKITEVQAQLAQVTYIQSKFSRLPNAQFTGNSSLNSGNNQDPITFRQTTQTYTSAGLQLQSSADIFNFYSKKNTIAANNWEVAAARANIDKLKNDIALSIANVYLQVLLAKEQENVTLVQVQQTTAQLTNTQKLVDAGSLPPLNSTQLEAQLAVDSGNYITAKGSVVQNILNLKAYMNLDPGGVFEVDAPSLESIPLDPIADLQPENVYALALKNQPLQRYNELKLKAAEKKKAAARGAMYPSLSAFGSLGSGYNNQSQQIVGSTPILTPLGSVSVGGTNYDVFPSQPFTNYTYGKTTFPNQLSDNFSQSAGLSLSVPLFNGRSLRSNYERSKLTISSLQLQKAQDDQTLKQNIFQAYNAVLIALEKFNASKRSVDASSLTYDYAQKRFDVGILNTFDLISTQNNLLRAKLEYSINRFDYVFKMKVLEFYKGNGIRL
ncbi:MAG: TolC family protein [Ferruginibacter sp.]|nr:TolC family protein [Ferruginibacter sp.]